MYGVTKIGMEEHVALVTLDRVRADLRFVSALLTGLAEAGINIDMISQSAPTGNTVNVSFTVQDPDLVKTLEVSKHFKTINPDASPLVLNGNSKIYLYGEEMRNTRGVAARALEALSECGVHILMITTSETDISLLLSDFYVDEALRVLEKVFEVKAG